MGDHLPKPAERNTNKVEVERVLNIYGSCAGAGSNFYPIYRKHRAIEQDQLRQMDEDWDRRAEEEAWQAKRSAGMMEAEEQTAKKAAKRQRRKEAVQKNAILRKEAEGVNQFNGDGSFLEQVKLLAEEFEKEKKEEEKSGPSKKTTAEQILKGE